MIYQFIAFNVRFMAYRYHFANRQFHHVEARREFVLTVGNLTVQLYITNEYKVVDQQSGTYNNVAFTETLCIYFTKIYSQNLA